MSVIISRKQFDMPERDGMGCCYAIEFCVLELDESSLLKLRRDEHAEGVDSNKHKQGIG